MLPQNGSSRARCGYPCARSRSRLPIGACLSRPYKALSTPCLTGNSSLESLLEFGIEKPRKRKNRFRGFGAEGGIRTLATVSHTTPLAGEPLEPLGYFCKAHGVYSKRFTNIAYFLTVVKDFWLKNGNCFEDFSEKEIFFHEKPPFARLRMRGKCDRI